MTHSHPKRSLWLLAAIGGLASALAMQACSGADFSSCSSSRTCSGGHSGAGGSSGGEGGALGESGALGVGGSFVGEGGTGLGNQAGSGASPGNAGAPGAAGSVDGVLAITQPNLATGKTYVPYASTITASGGASYTWTLASGALPAGLTLQNATSATVKIAGTPTEAGLFPINLSVTDGASTATVDLTLTVTHSVLFLSDRNATGVNELFLTDVGGATVPAPTRLNASFPSGGGVSSYAWSPDGSKVLYLASQSAGGTAELWVAAVATPGTAQRVSPAGTAVSQYAWLRAGNIGAYSTAAANTYLVELSGASPGPSQLVTLPTIAGTTATPGTLYPSPNGKSLIVMNNHQVMSSGLNVSATYVTWEAGAPTSLTLVSSDPSGSPSPVFSFDGRGVVIGATPALGVSGWDLSVASPTGTVLAIPVGTVGYSWAPNSESLLDIEAESPTAGVSDLNLRRLTAPGAWGSALLVPHACTPTNPGPWSHDGKSTLFRCGADLRGISDVSNAAASSDFSLLPSGFLQNAFTDIPSVLWSADSQWIALRADRDVNNQYDLFLLRWSAPGTAYKPYTSSVAPGITTLAFAQNSQSVAFVGTVSPQSSPGLYLTNLPASGAPPTAALVSAAGGAAVQNDITWLPGSRVIVYRAGASGAQLFSIPLDGSGTAATPMPVSGVSGSGVVSYQVDPPR